MSVQASTQNAADKKLIVVAGAGMDKEGTLFEGSKINVTKGLEVFKRDTDQITIFTAKYNYFLRETPPPRTEAGGMKAYAVGLGLPEEKTILEEKSYDTIGNAYYTDMIVREMSNVRSITVIASTWHLPKAGFIFEKVFGGSRFRLSFEEGVLELPADKAEEMRLNETKKLEKLKGIYGGIENGDWRAFAAMVELQHPFYTKNPVPGEEWQKIKTTVPTINYIK
jgi:hypothetical protein